MEAKHLRRAGIALAVLAGVTGIGIPASSASRTPVPAAQRAALADDTVTRAEYSGAVDQVRACVERAGIVPDEVRETPDGQLTFTMQLRADVEGSQADYARCHETYLSEVEPAYLASIAPSAAQLQARRDRVAASVRRDRPDFPEHPTGDDIGMALRAEQLTPPCQEVLARIGSY